MFQLADEQICGFSLTTASLSSSFDIADRLLTGRKFVSTDVSKPDFIGRGVTIALFIDPGNSPREKEAFARWAMITENSVSHCFRSQTGMMSRGEVFVGNF